MEAPQNIKIELPCDPAIPCLDTLEGMKSLSQRYFTVALFTIVKKWQQPKYPSTGEWITYIYVININIIYINIRISLSHEKKVNPAIATVWINPERIMLSEISQRKINTV